MFAILKKSWSGEHFLARSVLGLACILGSPVVADAQEAASPPADQPKAERDLTEGLLDLLTEPAPPPLNPADGTRKAAEKPQTPAELGPASNSLPSTPSTAPADDKTRGLGAGIVETEEPDSDDVSGGEDLGAARASPLAQVRLGMLTAAGWLREHSPVDKTEELQRDIVARLDHLIDDLNEQSPAPSPSSDASQSPSPSQPPPRSETPEPSAQQAEATKRTRQQQADRSAPTGEEAQAGESGSEGPPAPRALERKGVIVDLNDPRALQRSAWGNLPDRVRDQMQSRMVERFLPGYREEIEAYYRALSR